MTLPPKALSILVDIKKKLLSKSVMITPEPSTELVRPVLTVLSNIPNRSGVMITHKSTQVMRHARIKGPAVQRMYQRGEL